MIYILGVHFNFQFSLGSSPLLANGCNLEFHNLLSGFSMVISKAMKGLGIVRLCQESVIFAREERLKKEYCSNGLVMNWNLSRLESLRGLLTLRSEEIMPRLLDSFSFFFHRTLYSKCQESKAVFRTCPLVKMSSLITHPAFCTLCEMSTVPLKFG